MQVETAARSLQGAAMNDVAVAGPSPILSKHQSKLPQEKTLAAVPSPSWLARPGISTVKIAHAEIAMNAHRGGFP
jgi:hypothetical protein